MKQKILPSTIFEFTLLVIDGFTEENGLAPSLLKRKVGVPQLQKVPKKFEIFPAPSNKIRKNF